MGGIHYTAEPYKESPMRTSQLFAFLLLGLSFTGSLYAQSFLKFSEPGWDFGKREQTDTATKVIKVTNRGSRTVRVKKIELTCGCVQAKLGKMVLSPGDTTDLTLNLFATRGEGEIKKYVILHSDDPYVPKAKLAMTGFIRPIWTLDVKGRILEFGEVKNGESATKRVTLRIRPEFKIDLVEILAQPMGKQIEIKQTPFKEEDGHYGWHLDVTLSGALSNGDFEGVVRVETDFAKFRFRGFRILAHVVSTTAITPKVLRMGTVKAGTTWTGEIQLMKATGTGLKLISATSKDPRTKLTSEVIEAGKHIKVKVAITPDAKDLDVRGTILVEIDEPGYKSFEVKYRGRVQKKQAK